MRQIIAPKRAGGFTLLEFVAVVCIVAALATTLYTRLEGYQEGAERAAMMQTAAAVRSGLQMRVASLIIAGRDSEIEGLTLRNPVDFLTDPPRSYGGVLDNDASVAKLAPGSWFYDSRTREFVYLVSYDEHFTPGPDGRKWVRYRIVIEFEDGLTKRQFSAVRFLPTNQFTWN